MISATPALVVTIFGIIGCWKAVMLCTVELAFIAQNNDV
jgi:hypothetical protein